MPIKVFSTLLVVVLLSDFPMASSNVTGRSVDEPSEDFTCSSGKVVFARFVCDGEFDCGPGDKSDELNCSEHQNSRESNESFEELVDVYDDLLKLSPVNQPEQVTRKTLEDESTTDDSLHEDVAAIGRSWYKRFIRSSGTDVPAPSESAMVDWTF